MAGLIDTARAPKVPKQVPTDPLKPMQPSGGVALGVPVDPAINVAAPPSGGVALGAPVEPAINVAAPDSRGLPGGVALGAPVQPAINVASRPSVPDAPQPEPSQPVAPKRDENPPGTGIINGAMNTAWTPSEGLSGNIEEGQTQDVAASTYTPLKTPDMKTYEAVGYTPEGYTADQVDENLSQAVDRVISKGGPLAERARAAGLISAHSRGLTNSSMAVQSSYSALLDHALQIAQGDVDVSKFNVGQNNDALRFSADARNAASAFLANAKNMAAQFNTGEANKAALFSVEQANLAARFAAEAENAAKMFNADAFNQAKQKYADAVNAARAAEQDARNLALRDTATFSHQKEMQDSQNAAQLAAAGISANAAIQSAQIRADVDMAQLAQQRYQFDQTQAFNVDQLGQQAFNQYQQGVTNITLSDMDPASRDAALANHNAIWAGNPYLPIRINQGGGT